METKSCRKCLKKLPKTDFYLDRSHKDGLTSRCKCCLKVDYSGTFISIHSKQCSKCKNIKLIANFSRDKRYKDGLTRWCNGCKQAYDKEWRKKNPVKYRQGQIMKLYGISYEQYQGLLNLQGGKCGICGLYSDNLIIDHCHQTQTIRGLLCQHCNRGLGQFKDSVIYLKKAIKWISKEH